MTDNKELNARISVLTLQNVDLSRDNADLSGDVRSLDLALRASRKDTQDLVELNAQLIDEIVDLCEERRELLEVLDDRDDEINATDTEAHEIIALLGEKNAELKAYKAAYANLNDRNYHLTKSLSRANQQVTQLRGEAAADRFYAAE